jgi:hypothetical protein
VGVIRPRDAGVCARGLKTELVDARAWQSSRMRA